MSQFIEMFKGENMVSLERFCYIEKGSTITRNEVSLGDVPVIAGGQEPSCYHNASNREAGMITVSASGAYAGFVNYWTCPIFASDCNTIRPKSKEKTETTFLYYGLKAIQAQIYGLQKGGAQPHVYGKDLQKLLFPLPSIEKQRIFSRFAEQADKSEFDEFKSQFIEMFGTINSPKGELNKLGNLCSIQRGGSPRPIKNYITTDANGLNWIKIGDTGESMYITHTKEKIKTSGLNKTRQVYAGDLLLSNSMSFGRPYILKIDGCIHDGWLVLHIKDESKLTQIFLCSYLSQPTTYVEMSKLAAGGVVQNLNSEIVKKLPVILPTMPKQLEYISILNQADKSEKHFELRLAS